MIKKVNRCSSIDWTLTTYSPWIPDPSWKMYLYMISDVKWIVETITLKILGAKHPMSFSQLNKAKIKICIFISSESQGGWTSCRLDGRSDVQPTIHESDWDSGEKLMQWTMQDDDTFQPTTEICPFKSALSLPSSPPAATHLHPSTSPSTVTWLSPSRWAEAPHSDAFSTPSPVSRSDSDGKEQVWKGRFYYLVHSCLAFVLFVDMPIWFRLKVELHIFKKKLISK